MKHPGETTLALYAGGDLGVFARWATRRHLERCERCQEEAARFAAVRAEAARFEELPGVAWDRLAEEMRANIRLGLAAGEIVRPERAPAPSWTRAIAASACLLALLVAGLWLQRPAPAIHGTAGWVLENAADGVALRNGGQTLTLVNGRSSNVVYTAGAHGMVRARYVDADTGQVTINNVYAQ
jgi:anti-sigma factor RsiW